VKKLPRREDAEMKIASDQIRRQMANGEMARGNRTMQSTAISEHRDLAAARPIAELLACPPAVGNMLNASAECIEFDAGDVIFHQNDMSQGLYVVISGYMLRKTARLDTRLTLGTVRAGEVTELAAMLGDVRHTFTLIAQTKGTAMRLPKVALQRAFQLYPPLRMRLLEELAREVSRAYAICGATRLAGMRRRPTGAA
jgi:CRP-like cAMP-binding protein